MYALICFLAFICLTILSGKLITYIFRFEQFSSDCKNIVISAIVGYVLLISAFSLFQTSFKSISFIYLMLLVLFGLNSTKSRKVAFKLSSIKQLLWFLTFAIFSFALAYFSVHSVNGFDGMSYANNDSILYAKIAKYVSKTGEENGFYKLNELDSFYHGPKAYHYFDIWGGALCAKLFNLNEYLALRLIVYPFFGALVLLGFFSLFKDKSWWKVVLVIIIAGIGGIYFPFEESIPIFSKFNNLSFNFYNPRLLKLTYFYLFILIAFLFAQNKNYTIALIWLLFLPVANIITLPTIIPSVLIGIGLLLGLKLVTKKEAFKLISIALLIFISIVAFYIVFKTDNPGLAGAEISSPMKLLKDTLSLMNIRTQTNILLGSVLSIFILYTPLFLIVFSNYKSLIFDRTKLIKGLFIATICLVSLFVWAGLYVELNSSQIFYNLAIPALNITLVISTIWIINSNTERKPIFLLSFLVITLFGFYRSYFQNYNIVQNLKRAKHSQEYLNKVYESLEFGELIASLKGEEDMKEMHSKYNAVYPLGSYLFLMNKSAESINIGDLNTPIDCSTEINCIRSKKATSNGYFLRYANQHPDYNQKDIYITFLRKHNIHKLILSKNATIPSFMLDNVKLIAHDSFSGESFYQILN